jgi:DNA-binding HxlR family transcriptional regulator
MVRNVTANFSRAPVGFSQKTLARTLRRMAKMTPVRRRRYAETPSRVDYALAAAGRDLLVPIHVLGAWVDRHGPAMTIARYGEPPG